MILQSAACGVSVTRITLWCKCNKITLYRLPDGVQRCEGRVPRRDRAEVSRHLVVVVVLELQLRIALARLHFARHC